MSTWIKVDKNGRNYNVAPNATPPPPVVEPFKLIKTLTMSLLSFLLPMLRKLLFHLVMRYHSFLLPQIIQISYFRNSIKMKENYMNIMGLLLAFLLFVLIITL